MKAHGLEIIGGLTSDNSPSSMEIDNVVDNKSIIARDHGTATVLKLETSYMVQAVRHQQIQPLLGLCL